MRQINSFARGVGILAAGACFLSALALTACTDDESAAASPSAAAANPPAAAASSTPSTPNNPADPGSEEPTGDEEIVEEGGGLPPEDPTTADADSGAPQDDGDGGVSITPACGQVVTGAFVPSTCSSKLTILTGGALTTTNYTLRSVTVLGNAAFCSGAFMIFDHRGGLKVTASSPTEATFEFADLYRRSGSLLRPTIERYDVDVAVKGAVKSPTLAFTPGTCAGKTTPTNVAYAIGTGDKGKKAITLRLPYGTGTALYRFVES